MIDISDLVIVRALLDVARPEILKFYSPDSCIASTRIGIDVLAYFGIGAKPLPVEGMLLNKGGLQAFREDRPLAEGEWGLGLGFRPEGVEVGHVVILLDRTVSDHPDQISFIDLSVDQAARPEKNILPVPAVFTAPATWLTDESLAWAEFEQPWGIIRYRRYLEHRYKASPNWLRKRAEREVAGTVIRQMKERLRR